MNLRNLIEILSAIGVIASLIFVGLQLRLEAEATRSATVLQIKDAWVELNLAEATSSELSLAFQDVDENGFDAASYENRSHVTGFYRALLHNQSNAYYQYRIGVLDEELWAPHIEELKDMANRDAPLRIWKSVQYLYDMPFRTLFDGLIIEAQQNENADSANGA